MAESAPTDFPQEKQTQRNRDDNQPALERGVAQCYPHSFASRVDIFGEYAHRFAPVRVSVPICIVTLSMPDCASSTSMVSRSMMIRLGASVSLASVCAS